MIIIPEVILALAVIVGLWGVFIYNGLVALAKKRDEAWSGVLVQLKRRHDLVPNLVNVVKGYAAHEKGLLEQVAKLRSLPASASPAELSESEAGFSKVLGRLFAVAENYPDLKAATNFSELQQTLSKVEDEIQMARRYYNGTVRNLNTMVSTFPSMLIAKHFSFAESSYFELESLNEGAVPQVAM